MNLFWRIVLIMILGAWIIWPAWFGLFNLTLQLASVNLVLALLLTGFLTLVIMTLAPLKLRHYKYYTQVALVFIMCVFHYQAYTMGYLPLTALTNWLVTVGLSVIFIFVAWPMIANSLWQKTHNQRAVDAQDDTELGSTH